MIEPTIGFIVYGVHKDGLKDPAGVPFIDDQIVAQSEKALTDAGLKVVRHDLVIASKEEAIAALRRMKNDDQIDAVVLFSGTWVWAAHLVGAIRDYAATGKGSADLDPSRLAGLAPGRRTGHARRPARVGIPHKFVYGAADDPADVEKIVSLCRAAHLKNWLNMSTIGTFGGRGMGQTCGAADPSPVDAHVRRRYRFARYHRVIRTARKNYQPESIDALAPRLQQLFGKAARHDLSSTSARSGSIWRSRNS